MDKEQQIRINFLDETEEYFEQVESVILGLASSIADPQDLDRAMRAAHSVKGGSAMMGFIPLSQVAHRLEDFLKILRLRHQSTTISSEIETLLLQGVDCLRNVSALHRQGNEIDQSWLDNAFAQTFEPLQDLLGDLHEDDENALLQQEEDVDPALIIFEEGVEKILDRFEQQLQTADLEQLRQELLLTADELVAFGFMANLQPFIQLCQSVQAQTKAAAVDQSPSLAKRSLVLWRRSHALVLRGSLAKLPTELDGFASVSTIANANATDQPRAIVNSVNDLAPDSVDDFSDDSLNNAIATPDQSNPIDLKSPLDFEQALELEQILAQPAQPAFEPTIQPEPTTSDRKLAVTDADLDADSSNSGKSESELEEVQSPPFSELEPELELNDFLDFSLEEDPDLTDLQAAFSTSQADLDLPELEHLAANELEALQSAFALSPGLPKDLPADLFVDPFADQAIDDLDTPPTLELELEDQFQSQLEPKLESKLEPASDQPDSQPPTISPSVSSSALTPASPASPGHKLEAQTVRVPVEQLKQFNNLFGKLVLERNTVNLRLEQLKGFVALMRQRIYQLDQSNTQLRKWYDRASLEGIVPGAEQSATQNIQKSNQPEANPANPANQTDALQDQFDALELDRYSDLHLISQEQIETIVQIKEVSTDIDLELQEMTLAVQNLNQTTQSLQGNVSRTQMLSFAEAIKRYPRAVRDLSNQFKKPVNLVIEGETTLMDRAVLEALANPLMHLLRNAFDHGIEDRQTRSAAGKPAEGTIKLSAVNRGLQTVITLQDDGGGIRLDKIRDRVLAMGLSDREVQSMSDADILNCIFEPGFSTAEQVTELSGRGMGMDIVQTALKDIRGDIQVQSKPGLGTTFILRVPFTLSILRVMLLEQAGIVFAVPADTVQEVHRLESDWVKTEQGSAYLNRDDQKIDIVFLEQHLAFRRAGKPFVMPGTPVVNQPMAIIVGEHNEGTSSLYVSRHWGEQEVTLRPIISPLPLPPGFISSIVLGDGRVVPLVDPLELVEWCMMNHGLETDAAPRSPQPEAIDLAQTPTVLIVDDSVNVRRYLALTLEKAGYQVEQAKDGQEAVDKLNSGLAVHAVVCDIEMPRLDGYGVLEAIKSKTEFEQLPIVMLTSRSNEKHRKLALNLGASAYFSKPYEEEQLLETIADFISKSALPMATAVG
ncbi:CheA signal transduction histidine kinase [Thalassoporum mexicanum PCC 7367]|uniref:hybrid sensor histidine kinase/response regulator n=1 Tax=Thalassoporum mexicanum TaxID=3457544 RepID=UPI00029F8B42|nr:hybrid sensor histidine kinase/response regulator [Pseudanabaena sp. PCC 7367]AFY68890.1 CheA signal transduction histidine kinase [Pseudanabaena sp. PCC 7367]